MQDTVMFLIPALPSVPVNSREKRVAQAPSASGNAPRISDTVPITKVPLRAIRRSSRAAADGACSGATSLALLLSESSGSVTWSAVPAQAVRTNRQQIARKSNPVHLTYGRSADGPATVAARSAQVECQIIPRSFGARGGPFGCNAVLYGCTPLRGSR